MNKPDNVDALARANIAPAALQSNDYVTSAGVRQIYGGVSEMTLWRWTRDLEFPKPDKVINRRKFWRRSTLAAWDAKQGGTA